ncbi:hypothetical protein [Sessilibacter corallicola]|uniref:hypothetical protein n=1 Tax=Sessilibacter corallicola TaxID=2904075 RepID=UPI001E3CE4A8|nr:hypothetical protein [Sessilibacter corallicola]MCE2027223.1 hypothetical protein [Sessilibacter corallicola]
MSMSSFSYEDLTYIQSSLQAYSSDLSKVEESDCDEDYTFEEVKTDLERVANLLERVDGFIENFGTVDFSVKSTKE